MTWQVVAEDGDTVGGSYAFAVGATAVAAVNGPGAAGTRGLWWAALLRWALFAALALALGGLVGQRLAGRVVRRANTAGPDLAVIRAPVTPAAAVGALAVVGLAALLLGSGSVVTGLGRMTLPALWHSPTGRLLVVEAAGFVLAAVIGRSRRLGPLAAVPLLAVVVAEGRRSHLRELDGSWGWLLLVLHLAAAAIWVGALVHVVRVAWAWRGRPVAAHRVLSGYARVALLLVLVVVATGTLASIVVLPGVSALTGTGYGQLLLAKIGLVVVVLALAVASRVRLRATSPLRAPAGGEDVVRPGRAARIERSTLIAVLAVTAVLVSVATPRQTTAALTLPPPPTGPVVRLATLIGQVTVSVAASDGQLEVRTSVPNPGAENDSAASSSTNIAAELGPAGAGRPVALRRCGADCFVGPAHWSNGSNRLAVSATAKGWVGGSAAFAISWPPSTSTVLLPRMLAAMRAVRAVTVHEIVTSNTAAPAPPITTSTLTGADFLTEEPYSTAGISSVTVLGSDAGITEIEVAMLDQGYYFRVKLGPDERIRGEVITAPEHLLTRTFDYP